MFEFTSKFFAALLLSGSAAGAVAAVPAPGAIGRKEISTAFDLISSGGVDPIDKGTLAKACVDPMRAKGNGSAVDPFSAADAKSLTKFYDGLVASGSDERTLVRVCVEGMISATNHPGEYLDVEEATSRVKAGPGSTGISLKIVDGTPEVVSVYRGGPAESRLLVGDRISSINRQPISGKSLEEVVRLLRGPLGSTVAIVAQRDGVGSIDLMLTRAAIKNEVSVSVKEEVAIITLPSIYRDTPAKIAAALAAVGPQIKRGYIIDLRSCPGGLFDAAVEIADLFIDQGVIGIQQGLRPFDRETWKAKRGDIAKGLPLIVLTSHDTAAGAEIIASALRERRGAKLVGHATMGMATIKTVISLSDRAAFSFTTARILQANGASLERGGIKPDIDLTEENEGAILERAIAMFPALNG